MCIRDSLKDGETFLKENEIVFTDKEKVENWRNLKYELSTLAYQKPNSRVLWIPRHWFYYKVQNPSKRKIKRRARKDAKRLAKGKEKNERRLQRWARQDAKRLAKENEKNERGIKELEKNEKRENRRTKKLAKAVEKKKRNFSNWVLKSIAEEPVIYDKDLSLIHI